MTDLAQRLAQLTPAQRAVLDRRLREKGARAPEVPPVTRRRDIGGHALTVDQERIWLIHQFDPDDPAYNIFFAARLTGRLDLDAVRRAVGDFVARHEPLRTTFVAVDGRPRAVVHAQVPVDVVVTDLRHVPRDEREAVAQRLALDEIRTPFDLTVCPLMRIRLLRIADDEHLLIGTVDHLIWDRASLTVFNAEFPELYNAHATGRAHTLRPVELHYGDYAEWQPGWLSREVATRHLPYWREHLAGAAPALELPTDRPRPPVQTFHGARHQFRLTPELTTAIRELARAENVTVNVVLLAAWQLLLHRLSGQEDIVVGTTSSTRGRPETESMIGYFLTMLPLRVRVRPEMSFRELLGEARTAVLGGFDHHDVPFGVLLDALDVQRDPSRNPVYQSTFIYVDFVHEDRVPLHGLRTETVMLDNLTAKDDITLGFFDDRSLGDDHFYGLLEYNTDLFDAETVERIGEQVVQLLEQLVVDPGRTVADYQLMRAEQVHQVVGEWNATAVEREPAATVDRLVRERALRTPDAVAVRCGAQQWTYQQLIDRAAVIARRLRVLGVGPEVVVGVGLERSCDLVAALLGVLWAGGAYLPLDPSHPRERLAGIVGRSDARVVITTAEHSDDVPAPEVLLLDDLPQRETEQEPPASGDGRRLAYVMYTSGSTGTPKGVEITHGNLINVLLDLNDRVGVEPGEVLAAVTPVTFDIAGFELFGPLLAGATVTVLPRADTREGGRLARALAECGATVMQATPTTWRLLLDAGWRNPAGLRMLVGGEALPPTLAAEMGSLPGRAWNVYGPTETTIWSTSWPVPAEGGPVSIGRPLANTQVYVLDADRRPVPVGVPGDLYIGGAGVARGYRGAPELTAQRFLPDPFRTGGMLYRTGDRARWQRDGTLIFLGRDDNQVKLRGHRIELGEIESALERHPGVRRAVVIVREDRAGDARLVGYVEPAGEELPTAPELTSDLRGTLPDYMIPAAVVVLDTLPMTANGKLDRTSLPAPTVDRAAASYAAPRNPLELRIARIWEDVLDVRPVGVHDRFFDLGGHSLLVLRLMAELEAEFGVTLPMAAIFQGATVEQFARMVRDGFRPEGDVHAIRLRAGADTETPIFFVHPAGSEVVCYMPFTELVEPAERPLYALASPEPVDGRFPYETFEQRAAAFAGLIRELQPSGPYELVGWCYGGSNAYAVAAELERAGETASVVLIDAHPPAPVDVEPDRAEIVAAIAANLRWDHQDDTAVDDLRAMSDDEHIDHLLRIARAANYLPADSGRAQMASVVEMWLANLRLLWRYEPPPLRGPVTLVRAEAEELVPFRAWQSLAAGRFREVEAPGNHYTVVRWPHVRVVAQVVSDARIRALGDES
ncbi:amino acid adenylation domain-containing protein [Micromonospora echinofusca]|uniref:non-ribosomal peptide synthetase n=1 Tax=Micromonospora echinofusca TaxID=47858 RepID=UPI0020216B71|nr:non-ribosomal peptide synthetase [Micromonospora sp. MSM11]MCL7458333.1 amino acid adenylation domain-containing protein [Micromonospora sp. MSM11]